MAHLPREIGEAGALRASSPYESEPRYRAKKKAPKAARQWQEANGFGLDIGARLLRKINQDRFDASMARHHRPARVS